MSKDEVIAKLKSMDGAKSYNDEGDKYMYVYEVGPVRFGYDGSPVYFGTRDQAYAAWAVLTDEERGTLKEIGSGPVPPFDWSTVKTGMAFVCTTSGQIYRVKKELYSYYPQLAKCHCIFGGWPVYLPKSELTRCPYYDHGVFRGELL